MAVSALLLVSTETAQQHYIIEKGVPVGGEQLSEHVDITYGVNKPGDSYPGNALCTWPSVQITWSTHTYMLSLSHCGSVVFCLFEYCVLVLSLCYGNVTTN